MRFPVILIASAAVSLLFGGMGQTAARDALCPPRPARQACLAQALEETGGALIAARHQALKAIAAWDGNLDAADRAAFARRFEAVFQLWLGLRDRQCDAVLIRRLGRVSVEAADLQAMACRVAIGRVIAGDLNARFEGPAGDARFSFSEAADGRPIRRHLIGAEGAQPLCRHPGSGGDYAPLTACFARHVARLDRQLAALQSRIQATIRRSPGLSAAERRDWAERAAALEAAWRELRDKGCALEAFETPNRFANSIASQVTGPCLVSESEARLRQMRGAYAVR